MAFRPRIAEAELRACLGAAGAVLFEALERLMVQENQPAWRPHLRSKAALRQAPRRHFCDPSLAVAALGGSPDRLLKDLEWLGLLFESLVIRDLRVLTQALEGELFHYRDDYGVEVDAIVQLRDGRWDAIEIKLGAGQVEAAAAPANPPSWRWSAAAALATGAPMASPWCRWVHWGLEQAQAIARPPLGARPACPAGLTAGSEDHLQRGPPCCASPAT